jgi:hypothetical protein
MPVVSRVTGLPEATNVVKGAMAKSLGWAEGTYYQQMLQLCAADFEERPTALLNFVRPLLTYSGTGAKSGSRK